MPIIKGPITFDMIPIEGPYTGYYDPAVNWNGFLCPYFDKENSIRILKDTILNEGDNIPGSIWGYNEKDDFFFLAYPISDNYPFNDNLWIIKGQDIIFEGAPVRVYAIGSYGWCWVKGDLE